MARKFTNPQGTFSEKVGIGTNIATFFFGALALAVFGLWSHFVIWMLVIIVAVLISPTAAVIAWFFLTFVYTFMASDFRCEKYLRTGWSEENASRESDLPPSRKSDLPSWVQSENVTANYSSDTLKNVSESFSRDTQKEDGLKKCPFCAESIKIEAIKCKHCGSMLESQTTSSL